MADTSIKINLEVGDAALKKAMTDFIGQGNTAEKGIKKLGDTGKNTFNEIGISIGKASGFYDIFAGNLAANLATKAFESLAAGANQLFQTLIVDGVKAAQEQQDANQALNIALAQTGQFSSEAAARFGEFADKLQSTTGVADDAIITNAALIQSLGQLDEQGLTRATEAAVNLSAALGKDLGSTSEALGKAAAGNTTAIQKMGIQFEKGSSDAATFNNILAALEDRFGGAAAQKVNTYSGAIKLAGANFGELQEEVGNVVVENNVVIEVIKSVGHELAQLTGFVGNNSQAWKELVGKALIGFIDASIVVVEYFDYIARGFGVMFNVIRTVADKAVASMIAPFTLFSETVSTIYDTLIEDSQIASQEIGSAFTKQTGLDSVKTSLIQIQQSAEQGFEALKSGASTSVEPVNQVKTKVTELTDEQKKLNQETVTWANSLASTVTANKAQYDLDLENIKFLKEQKLISDQEYFTQLEELEKFKTANEILRLDEAQAQGLLTQTKYAAAREQLEKKESLAVLKIKEEQKKKEDELEVKKFNAVKDTFGNIASLMQTTSRELFEIGKAAAIAQATMNTFQAITLTLANFPGPIGIALAVAQGIAGFVQVANIAATQPRFEQGGIVPGNSFTGDKVSARVNSGEMVLNRGQQKQLFAMANGQTGGNDGRVEQLIGMVTQVLNQPISVQIDGKEVFSATRQQLAMGRTF